MSSIRYLTRFAATLAFAISVTGAPAVAGLQQIGGQQSMRAGVAVEGVTAPRQQDKAPSLIEALKDLEICCTCDPPNCCPC